MNLHDLLACRQPILMDGAMGTELIARGHRPPLWKTPANDVLQLHRGYIAAGARVLVSNTLTLPADADFDFVLPRQAGLGVTVLGSLGPLNDVPNFPDRDELIARVRHLVHADAILLETCSDATALEAAGWIREAFPNVPVIVSFAFRPGEDDKARDLARLAESCDIAMLGVNCGRDQTPADVGRMLGIFRAQTRKPLLARPNAGTIPLDAETWAAETAKLLDIGLVMIGGCCGTRPEHIRSLAKYLPPRD